MPDLHGWITQQIDGLAAWLCRTRRGTYVAEWIWRACRMW